MMALRFTARAVFHILFFRLPRAPVPELVTSSALLLCLILKTTTKAEQVAKKNKQNVSS